ncbi:DNA alkylation repair protein [Micromonospora sp. NPDC049497]|uniref:DNA alkylation repair protein n=1 Tax=Micromonospora sp. NPDC049497 TaxID=3364273 RepID=UPI0037B60FCA
MATTAELLTGSVHEERLTSIFILVRKFAKADEEERGRIFSLVLAHTGHIDNWDLVDSSAPYIVGPWLVDVTELRRRSFSPPGSCRGSCCGTRSRSSTRSDVRSTCPAWCR